MAGRAGERFCVRNSGAIVVVEGCGANGCEYMTGGTAVILGSAGINFGAGMTGGMAYLYNPDGKVQQMINYDSLVSCPVSVPYWKDHLFELINEHVRETGSVLGNRILNNWEVEGDKFLQVCPKEMLSRIPVPITEFESQLIA